MWAHKKNNNHGFTIVETLIVLAVTSAMFVATVSLVSGQVARYRYQSSMRQLQTLMQRQINDVQSGYFPDGTIAGAGCVTEAPDGKSTNCFIVGKRITLNNANPNETILKVETLGADSVPVSLSANLKTVKTVDIKLPYDITFKGAYNPTPPNGLKDKTVVNILYSSALTDRAGVYNAPTNKQTVSGGESIELYDNTPAPASLKRLADATGSKGVLACFTNGSKNGSITFGNQNSRSVDLQIQDDRCN